MRAVFPLPTGPPRPTVKARSCQSRLWGLLAVLAVGRSLKLPGCSMCSWLYLCVM